MASILGGGMGQVNANRENRALLLQAIVLGIIYQFTQAHLSGPCYRYTARPS